MTGLRDLLCFGSSYLCLSGAEQKIWIWWSGSTGPFGKGSYLESRDNLEDALIEQGESKVIHKQLWDIQEGFILTYLSLLINRVKRNTRKALLPWMKFYSWVNVTDHAVEWCTGMGQTSTSNVTRYYQGATLWDKGKTKWVPLLINELVQYHPFNQRGAGYKDSTPKWMRNRPPNTESVNMYP